MRLIVCRNCTESDCTYCNINILAVALERGFLNSLMREQHTVQIDSELVSVRHGHWKWMGETGDSRYMCSVCKSKEDVPTCNGEPTVWEYCPNCGAKMDEVTVGQVKPSDGERKEVETGNTYSIGKIELPKGVFRQIYDEERREDETD